MVDDFCSATGLLGLEQATKAMATKIAAKPIATAFLITGILPTRELWSMLKAIFGDSTILI
ncbi:MAG TPA: hypothetical protein VLZ12_14570 [Verrucomicrobiae bacterium]|nr:hypothetical protein [Verrucomicrobiae bacterium]